MNAGDLFLGLALVSLIWVVISSSIITAFVAARGERINYFLYRLFFLKYLEQYRRVTQAENGRPGPWYYAYFIALGCTLGFAVLGLMLQ